MDKALVEKEFGFLRDRGTVQLDICTVGIPPHRTQLAGNAFMAGYTEYAQGIDEERYYNLRCDVREKAAALINGDADGVAITKNTTEGVSILASGYPLGPGDNVVTVDMENQSNLFPWFNNARIRGYELRVAKSHRGSITPEELDELSDEHTKIVSISAVQAGSGFFADLAEISRRAHAKGAILAVDAIQAIGRVRVDVKKMGIDYLSCGGFKGLLSGFGTGFLWCKNDLLTRIIPPYAGYQSAGPYISTPGVTPGDTVLVFKDDISRLEAGTYNMHGALMMQSSISLLLELGPDEIAAHVTGLEKRLRARLAKTKLDVVDPGDERRYGGMTVVYYPRERRGEVEAIFERRNIKLTTRFGFLRLAFGVHNTEADADAAADAFDEMSALLY